METSKAMTCWECEATTNEPIAVTIVLPTAHGPRVQLCPSCYRTYYLPLLAEATGDGAPQAPPAPSRRSPGTGRARR